METIAAVIHFFTIFILVSALATQFGLLSIELTPDILRILRRADLAYGLSAAAALATGAMRIETAKGWHYYLHNEFFLAKATLFLLVAAVSVPPTVAYLRWGKRARDGSTIASSAERSRMRTFVFIELSILCVLVPCAVLMARGLTIASFY